ncbi:MAG: FtsX-like permease family protein, partial [Thermoplasmata archaeon]|nr:FtsX-like permease family protein [Thermoplasmata archaeon]
SKDIRILHGMGGSDRWIMGVFTLEAASASFVGGVMGIILGIVGANLIVSGFTLIGYTMLLSPHATMGSTLVPLGIALGAGILGGGTVSYLSIRRKRGGTS